VERSPATYGYEEEKRSSRDVTVYRQSVKKRVYPLVGEKDSMLWEGEEQVREEEWDPEREEPC